MPEVQSFKNHTRNHPPFHFFVGPVLFVNLVLSIYYTIHQWPMHSRSHLWWIVMSVAFLFMAGLTRTYALKNQDRTIRLEERLRYALLLSPTELAAAQSLSMTQIVALRFASDAELPALLARTLKEGLDPKTIKQSITNWRADNHRI